MGYVVVFDSETESGINYENNVIDAWRYLYALVGCEVTHFYDTEINTIQVVRANSNYALELIQKYTPYKPVKPIAAFLVRYLTKDGKVDREYYIALVEIRENKDHT